MNRNYLYSIIICFLVLTGIATAYMDLNREEYTEADIVQMNDSNKNGAIDSMKIQLTGLNKESEPEFFVVTDGFNNFPWNSNRIEDQQSTFKITAPSGIAEIRTREFKLRISENGRPDNNIVTESHENTACTPRIKDPGFQVWEDSIKVDERVPYEWTPGRDHSISYRDLENGVETIGEGRVLRQRISYLPEEIGIEAKGDFRFAVHNPEGLVFKEELNGTVDKEISVPEEPRKGDYVLEITSFKRNLTVKHVGSGNCIQSPNP